MMTLQEYIDLSEERRMAAALQVAQAHVPGTGRRIFDSTAAEAGNAAAGTARVVTLEVQGELVPVTLAVVESPSAEAEDDPARSAGRDARGKPAAVSVTVGDETHVFTLGGAPRAMSG